jgi:hypothetical protein
VAHEIFVEALKCGGSGATERKEMLSRIDIVQAVVEWLKFLLKLSHSGNSPGGFILFSLRNALVFFTEKIILYLY